MLSLELNGKQAIVVPMTTSWIVKHFDVIEHISSGFLTVNVNLPLDAFTLEQLEEALGHRVVIAVPTAINAGDQAVRLEEIPPVITAESPRNFEADAPDSLVSTVVWRSNVRVNRPRVA
jgi:hypothetical protein